MIAKLLRGVTFGLLAVLALQILNGLLRARGLTLDFANFYDAGRKALAGEFASLYDAFAPIDGAEPLGNMTFFSAPLTAFLYSPLALLTPRTASFAFKLAGTIAYLWGIILLLRAAAPFVAQDESRRARQGAALALALLLFQPFWVIYAVGGQTTPFVFLLAVLGWCAWLDGRHVLLGLIWSLIVIIKPAFAPAAVLLFVMAPNRFRLTALALAAVVGGTSLLVLGWPLHETFLALVGQETRLLSLPWLNSSPASWIEPLVLGASAYIDPGESPRGLRLAMSMLRTALAGALIWRLVSLRSDPRLGSAARDHATYATALLLVIVLSPVVWSHYLSVLWLPVFLLLASDRLRRLSRGLLWAAIAVAPFQNLLVVNRLLAFVPPEGTVAIVGYSLLKSLPALLILAVWLVLARDVAATLADPAWSRIGSRRPTERR